MADIIAGRYREDPSRPPRHGGFGDIHFCHDELRDRHVVVKLARPPSAQASQVKSLDEVFGSLRHEAGVLRRVRHRNVVELFDEGEWHARPFIVLEFVPGETLHSWRESQPNLVARVSALAQGAQALAAVHAAGFVHLDVKPENLLCQHDGRVVLIDFGTARIPPEALVPGPGTFSTAAYSAPEQFPQSGYLKGDHVNSAADIFAFGIVAFELLTGRHPFGGDDQGVMHRIVNESVQEDLTALVPGIPDEVAVVLSRSLRKRPERPSADRVFDRLSCWLGQLTKADVRRRALTCLSAGRPLEAAELWERHSAEHPDDREAYVEIAGILLPPLVAAVDGRRLEDAMELARRIDAELVLPEQRAQIIAQLKRLEEQTKARDSVPRLVDQCKRLDKTGNLEHAHIYLQRALEIDPGNEQVVEYQLEKLRKYLAAADELWYEWNLDLAVRQLQAAENECSALLQISETARRYIRSQVSRWKEAVLDGFQVLIRRGDEEGVRNLWARAGEFLAYDEDLCRQATELVSRGLSRDEDQRQELIHRIRADLAFERTVEALEALRAAQTAFPGDPLWGQLDAEIRRVRETMRSREMWVLETAMTIRKALQEGAGEHALQLLEEAERLAPGRPQWPPLRAEYERKRAASPR